MDIHIRKTDAATILDLNGPFVMADAPQFKARVQEALDGGAKRLAVNLGAVTYLDSSGIGAIVGAFSKIKNSGGQCKFYAPTDQVLKVLKMVRLDTILDLRPDEVAALASFQA